MTKRVKLTVAYDGTNYGGWQIQPNAVTIEQVLAKSLQDLLGEPVKVMGASRTDAGVHALGNVAVFDTAARMPAEKMAYALNARLPEDIRVQDSRAVAPDFHPRFCKSEKTYVYRILNRRFPDPTQRLSTLFFYVPLDVGAMREAAAHLVGEHDFRSFCTKKPDVENTVRTIYALDVEKEGDLVTVRIRGNGFLYHMVRIITGTLLRVGTGYWDPRHVPDILAARDRCLAGETAPAHGLTLVGISYMTDACGAS